MNWLPIETAPKDNKMFAVIAKDVQVTSSVVPYTTDPYYVFCREHSNPRKPADFIRWPHPFMPTHWHPAPDF